MHTSHEKLATFYKNNDKAVRVLNKLGRRIEAYRVCFVSLISSERNSQRRLVTTVLENMGMNNLSSNLETAFPELAPDAPPTKILQLEMVYVLRRPKDQILREVFYPRYKVILHKNKHFNIDAEILKKDVPDKYLERISTNLIVECLKQKAEPVQLNYFGLSFFEVFKRLYGFLPPIHTIEVERPHFFYSALGSLLGAGVVGAAVVGGKQLYDEHREEIQRGKRDGSHRYQR